MTTKELVGAFPSVIARNAVTKQTQILEVENKIWRKN